MRSLKLTTNCTRTLRLKSNAGVTFRGPRSEEWKWRSTNDEWRRNDQARMTNSCSCSCCARNRNRVGEPEIQKSEITGESGVSPLFFAQAHEAKASQLSAICYRERESWTAFPSIWPSIMLAVVSLRLVSAASSRAFS